MIRDRRNPGVQAAIHEAASVADEFGAILHERMSGPVIPGVKTGIPALDDRLPTFRQGGLYLLAARHGAGQMALAVRIAQGIASAAENPRRVLFISLDADRVELMQQIVAGVGQFKVRNLEQGISPEHEADKVQEVIQEVRRWTLEVLDPLEITAEQIRSVIEDRQRDSKSPIEMVIVDHIHLITGTDDGVDDYAQTNATAQKLKIMALELNVPVLALAILPESDADGPRPIEPRLSDLHQYGPSDRVMDGVIILYRADCGDDDGPEAHREIHVKLCLNRFGPTGCTTMRYWPATQHVEFEEVEP